MKLAVLYYPHREGHNSVFPLLAYRDFLRDAGIEFTLYTSISDFLVSKSEVLIISGISLPKLLGKKGLTQVQFLKSCYERNVPLIYLAGSDSTGPFDADLIQWVDMFLARQLVKDRTFYLTTHRRHLFRDRYFSSHHFRNEEDFPLVSYSEAQVNKLGLFWNLGLIDWKTQTSSKLERYFNIWRRNSSFPDWDKGEVLEKRDLDVTFRGNLFKSNHDASRLHRLQTYRVYKEKAAKFTIAPEGLISHKKYMEELKSVKICLSPFGWGEVCYRDFEAFQSRALLLKPDMSHLETFPNFYTAETMVTYDWNARDLSEKINVILNDIRHYQEVADYGYDFFIKNTKSKEAGVNFSLFLKKQMKTALKNFSLRGF